MNPNGEDAASIKQDNGEGNHASTSDSQITDQDVDLGLTLPPSDLLLNTSCFAHDAAYSSKFAFPAQEGVIEDSSTKELPRFHGIFDDDFYLEEPPAKRQRFKSGNDPLPSHEDEAVSSSNPQSTRAKVIHQSSASNIHIRAPSIVSETGTQQSRTDSGYGTNITESCERIEDVNDRRPENIQLPDSDAGLWGDHAHFGPFDVEFNAPPIEENEDSTFNNSENITLLNPEPILQPSNEALHAPPKADVPTPSSDLHLPTKGRGVYTARKVPSGFGSKKMSRAEVIKNGASAGLFPNSHQIIGTTPHAISKQNETPSRRKPQPQKSSTSIAAAQNTMDLPLPLAICAALSESAIRPATLATIYRTQSAILHDPGRLSQPPTQEGSFLKVLGTLYERFQTERSLRDTVITFVLKKLEERADDPETVRPTLKWMALEKDLAAMESAMKDISNAEPKKQQLGLEAGSKILKRNADHIKELVAGMPHMKSLEARIKSQSKQIEALSAKCQELKLQAQYQSAIAQAAKQTEALVPTPVRMPPPLPSAFTPFEELPEDLFPQPHKIYRMSAPPVNTAWMCAHIDLDSGEHCGAIMRSWIKHRQRGYDLWISHTTCVKCKQIHKSLAFKYFLHESEVQQLGGISQGRRKQDDSPKSQDETPKSAPNPVKGNREPVQVATPSPELQRVSTPAPSGSVPPTQAPAATHKVVSEHFTRRSTQTSSSIVPEIQKLNVPPPVRHSQNVSITPVNQSSRTQPLHPAVVDPRRAATAKPAASRRPAPSARLNIPNPTFGRNVRSAFSAHPPSLQQYSTAHPPSNRGQSYYLQPSQQGSYDYDKYLTPPHASPYPPQHTQQYHWTPQKYYGQTIQQSEYGPPPDRRFSGPPPLPPRQQQAAPGAQCTNLGMPQTIGLGLGRIPPAAPTPKPAVPAIPPAPATNQLKRPSPTDADVIILDGENPSSLDDSQSPAAKKQYKSKPPKNPRNIAKSPAKLPRKFSLAPIAKQTVDTLRSSMKLPEKPWMRNADLSDTFVISDGESEGASPFSSQVIGEQAPEPSASKVAPPKKTRKRAKAASKPKVLKEAPAKKRGGRSKAAPKVVESVEELPAEAIVVAPAPTSVMEAQTPLQNLPLPLGDSQLQGDGDADGEGDNDSLFGDSEDTSREMTDEMADEWAKELEAEMVMTPEEESEEWGRELEAEMELTPDVAEESEEE